MNIIKITQTSGEYLLINSIHIIKVFQEESISFICLVNGDEIETEMSLNDIYTLLNN